MSGGASVGLDPDFVAFCLDLSRTIGTVNTSSSYSPTSDPFSNGVDLATLLPGGLSRAQGIQKLFDAVYGDPNRAGPPAFSLTVGNQSAGFQVALWELVYENGSVLDAANGGFKTSNSNVNNIAQGYLNFALGLNSVTGYAGPKLYNLTFLQSDGDPGRQNLVSATVVPLPAAGFLLIGGLGALAMVRRRREAATA
jgi:hypothetical protein